MSIPIARRNLSRWTIWLRMTTELIDLILWDDQNVFCEQICWLILFDSNAKFSIVTVSAHRYHHHHSIATADWRRICSLHCRRPTSECCFIHNDNELTTGEWVCVKISCHSLSKWSCSVCKTSTALPTAVVIIYFIDTISSVLYRL